MKKFTDMKKLKEREAEMANKTPDQRQLWHIGNRMEAQADDALFAKIQNCLAPKFSAPHLSDEVKGEFVVKLDAALEALLDHIDFGAATSGSETLSKEKRKEHIGRFVTGLLIEHAHWLHDKWVGGPPMHASTVMRQGAEKKRTISFEDR